VQALCRHYQSFTFSLPSVAAVLRVGAVRRTTTARNKKKQLYIEPTAYLILMWRELVCVWERLLFTAGDERNCLSLERLLN